MAEPNLDELFAAAGKNFDEGRFTKACRLYERVIESGPWNEKAYYRLGLAFEQRGRYEQAIEKYKAAVKRGFSEPEVHYASGRALAELKKYDEAIAEYALATQASSKLTEVYVAAGQVYLKKGDFDAAVRQFASAIAADRGLLAAHLQWAEACQDRREYGDAFDHLCEALELAPADDGLNVNLRRVLPQLEQQDAALQKLQEIVERLNTAPAYLEWGKTLLELKKFESAIEQFLKGIRMGAASQNSVNQDFFSGLAEAVKQLPDPKIGLAQVRQMLEQVKLPIAYLYWAEALRANDLLEEALDCLRIAFTSAPAEVIKECLLVDILTAVEAEISDSEIKRMQAVIDSSNDAAVRLQWGVTLCRLERHEQGIVQFEREMGQSELPEAHAGWGYALFMKQRFEQAIPRLLDAINLSLQSGLFGDKRLYWWRLLNDAASESKTLPEGTINRIQKIVEDLNSTTIMVKWALTLIRNGQADPALRQLEVALSREPADESDYQDLSQLKDDLAKKPELIERLDALVSESKNSRAKLEWGKTIKELRGLEQAIEHFEQAASLDPENAEAHQSTGAAYASREQYSQAIECYLRAIEADPTLEDAYTGWAKTISQLETRQGLVAKLVRALTTREDDILFTVNWDEIQAAGAQQAEQVENLCREIERNLDAGNASAYINCGVELEKQGRLEESLRLYRGAIRLAPENHIALYNCGGALAQFGQHDEAIEKYKASLELKPNRFDTYCGLARSYMEQQHYDEAGMSFAEAFEKGTDLAFYDSDERCKKQIEAYNDWAFALSEARSCNRALETAQMALRLKPDEFWTHFRMAYTYVDMMLYDQAMAKYEEAKRIDHQNPYVHHNIADLLEQQGMYRSAREKWKQTAELYQKGLKSALEKRDASYCLYYGWVRKDVLHDSAGAETLCRAARALDPANARIHSTLVGIYLDQKKGAGQKNNHGKNKKMKTDLSNARTMAQWRAFESYRAAKQILSRTPAASRDAGAWVELGELHLLMEREAEAEEAFTNALAKSEDSARVHKGLGELYLRTDRYDHAIRHLKASLQLASDDFSVRVKLAQAHSKSGALDEAESEYERVLSVTRFHLDALIGLARVYLEMADKLPGGREASGREYLYARAIDRFSEAIRVAKLDDCPTSFNGDLSSVYYLRGYAKVQLYEASRLAREASLVREALRDFDKCQPLDADYHKAQRAIARIKDEALRTAPHSLIERGVPALISLLSILVFLLAQLGFFYGFPVRKERIELTGESFAALVTAGVSAESVQKLKQIESLPFQNREELLTRAKGLLGENGLSAAKDAILHQAVRTRGLEYERIEVGYYALLTFGALLFMIAGAYLPQLTSLKLPGLQLDKSTAERVETVRSIGVSK